MASKSSIRRAIYEAIADVAQPGDICFFITEDPDLYHQLSVPERMYRKWLGFAHDDISIWHLGLLSKFEKKSHSSQIRPYIIHSTEACGVFEQHISPEYFTSRNMHGQAEICRTIMEVLRFEEITDAQVEGLIEFCRHQLGKPFPKSIRGESLTYILGLPNIMVRPNEFACHTLIYAAFDYIGVDFPHHLEGAPLCNLARYLGHPLGHSGKRVNPDYPYLRDHCLYMDPRFSSIISLTWEQSTDEIFVSNHPGKFSWNPHLADIYRSALHAN
jgi:hypothetical protein